MDEERRRFSRVSFEAKALLEFEGQRHEAELLDISLKGALIRTASLPELKKGEACSIELILERSEVVLRINAVLVYLKGDHFGLKFKNIDLDSMIHLRRLVELNIGDSELVRKELFFLVDSH